MYKNAMVASSKKQAEAMIAWLKLSPGEWEPVAYGDKIDKLFSHAKLVRPSDGVHQEHTDWVLGISFQTCVSRYRPFLRTGRSRKSTSPEDIMNKKKIKKISKNLKLTELRLERKRRRRRLKAAAGG